MAPFRVIFAVYRCLFQLSLISQFFVKTAALPDCLFVVWNKSLENLEVPRLSEGADCRLHLRWRQDRLLCRENAKCQNAEDFLWRCSNLQGRFLQLPTREERPWSVRFWMRGKWGDGWITCLILTSSTNALLSTLQLHPLGAEISEAHLPKVLLSTSAGTSGQPLWGRVGRGCSAPMHPSRNLLKPLVSDTYTPNCLWHPGFY